MSVQIKHRDDGRVLYTAEGAADVRAAVVEAMRESAYLYGANLYGANLSGADLSGADLHRANLTGATGIAPELVNDLLILLDQPGKIRAYKLVNQKDEGPLNGGLKYIIGETVEVPTANTDPAVQCAAGINVATLPWCLRNWQPGYRILVVEFTAKDIAAIPVGDGKFRIRKCRVIGEKEIDPLSLLGLAKDEGAPS